MSAKQLIRVQIFLSIVCSILIISGSCAIYHFGGFNRADNILYDFHFRWRGPIATSGKVILVLMDDRSAVELKRKRGQWSRKQTAQALYNLNSAGVEIIGLDMILADPDPDPAADKALAKAIFDCNNIVLARISSTQSGGGRSSIPLFQSEMIGEGFIDVPLDSDDVWRRLRYFNAKPLADGSLQFYPAFALELVRTFLYIDFIIDSSNDGYFQIGNPDKENILLPRPELLINFHGNYTAFPLLSYCDVVNNRFDPEIVKGKIVIIGSSLAINKDKYSTPFSLYRGFTDKFKDKFKTIVHDGLGEKDLGVACQAHAIETILSQKYLIPLAKNKLFILLFICGLIGTLFYLPVVGILWDYIILGLTMGCIIILSHIVFLKIFLVIDTAPLITITISQFIAGMVLQKGFARKKTTMVTDMFGKYVPRGVVNELIKGDIDISLTGRHQELTMLFSDLKNFTTLSEALGATETSTLLNTYFGAMIPLVFKYQGTLDKLMGDAIMAFFGAPLPVPDHPVKAAKCALAMLKILDQLKQTSNVKGIDKLEVGIGINTGQVTVGNLGSKDFMDYTIIGDPVNLASRLEGLKSIYSTKIIISQFTASKLDDDFLLRELDLVRVKGKLTAIKIYELYCYRTEASQKEIDMISLFESGLDLFCKCKWDKAEKLFIQALKLVPNDGPSALYLERIANYRQSPPEHDWDGVTKFGHK